MRPPLRILTSVSLLALIALGSVALAGKAGDVRTESFTLLNQGVTAYKRGEFALAVEKLERSASMALNSFRAHFYLGLALIGDRRYSDAIDYLEIALDLDPNHIQSLVAVGDANLKQGDLDEARASYFRALKLRPEYPGALDGLARIHQARSEDDEAIAAFRRAISSDPGYAPAFTHLGDLYLGKNQVEEAVRLLEEAVAVRPDFAAGLNRLSIAYGRLGLDNEAVATIQRAMELEPHNPGHPATLGWLQLRQGFLDTAVRWFEQSLDIDEAHPVAREGMAEVARRRGDYDGALDELDTALADPRIDAVVDLRLRNLKVEIEQEQIRLTRLEEGIGLEDAAPEDFAALARIYAGRGLWSEAIELQRRAGETPEQQERLAYMLFEADRFEDAYRLYGALASRSPDAGLEVNTGVSVARLGNDPSAVEAFRRALAIDPDSAKARLFLANALLRLGRRDEAVAAYRSFLGLGTRGEAAERVRRILAQLAPEPETEPTTEPQGAAEGTGESS